MKTVQSTIQRSARWAGPLALTLLLIFMVPLAQSDPGAGEVAASDARTVLITGANRGIGLELARQYSAAGWHVIGTARKPESAQELIALGAEVVQLDVTDPASAERLSRALGSRPVSLLINNAGILPMMRSLEEIDMDTFERVMDVNTLGPVRVTRAVLHPGWVRTDMGGPNAPTTAQESALGIRRVIEGLTEADNGAFFSFEGERMPW